MSEMVNYDKIRKLTKDQLVEKVRYAQNDISMVGTIAFDFPWKDMINVLSEKFKNDNFTIHILRESETTIAQYALLTLSQEEEREYGNLSRGNLIGIKEKVIRDLKESLSMINGGNNIEPPEDKYAVNLTQIYYAEKRKYILNSYRIHGCESAFEQYIEDCIRKKIKEMQSAFMTTKEFAMLVSERIAEDPDLARRFNREVNIVLEKAINEASYVLKKIDNLLNLDLINKTTDMKVVCEKKGESAIKKKLELRAEGLEISVEVRLPIETWIDEFSMGSDKEDINYRLKADKEQAIKRASEVKRKKLEEYRNDPLKKQRLFIKNCYMPIPVPMIKIDKELFITMALTKFDGIQKFQYIGNIEIDKKSGKYKVSEGQEGYRSLWLEEFGNYYAEYFLNENGSQKYSTEETLMGNRKEVIDIFDENRNRIGIGPRDAFLSNMAIVKSVVWALIFDREGRILIHKRSKNAKDNQDMWDKSVGGHVSTEDLDTIEAIKREITEELFTIENDEQGGHDIVQWMITNKNKIIYLGDWKTARFPDLSALNLSPDEYYNFSLNYPDINKRDFRREIVVTERALPNGETVKAKCFVDAYLCIVSKAFDIKKLQNSKYALLTPNELKRCVIRKSIRLNENRIYDANAAEEEFIPTSDLAYLVESAIWDDIVTEFAKRVKETFKNSNGEHNEK